MLKRHTKGMKIISRDDISKMENMKYACRISSSTKCLTIYCMLASHRMASHRLQFFLFFFFSKFLKFDFFFSSNCLWCGCGGREVRMRYDGRCDNVVTSFIIYCR
jgi:hypothetical protein